MSTDFLARREKKAAYMREWRRRGGGQMPSQREKEWRDAGMRWQGGRFTVKICEQLIAGFGNRCGACGSPEPKTRHNKWCVDHEHGPGGVGEVRGILCGPCNTALGMARDSPARLLGLFAYMTGIRLEEAELRNISDEIQLDILTALAA